MATFLAKPGRWALYSGADDAPFDNPRGNLGLVHAHSDFDYIQFSSKAPNFDVTITTATNVPSLSSIITIGPHGKPGIPFVFGRLLMASGIWVPLNGSTLCTDTNRPDFNYKIAFHLAVSNTDVVILETRSYPDLISISLRVQIWVSDNIVEGTLPSLPDTVMAPGLFTAGHVDSRKFYLRRKPGADLAISAGRTLTIAPGSTPENTGEPWQAWRYSNGGVSIDYTTTKVGGFTKIDNSPPPVNPVSYSCMIGGDVDTLAIPGSLEINPGNTYARVIGSDGTVVIDTREELFHTLSRVDGSVTRPQLRWGSTEASTARSDAINLGAVDPTCTGVIGLARITYSTGYSTLPSGYWLCVGGTILAQMKNFQGPNGNWGSFPTSFALLSFVLNGNQVELQENIRLKDTYYAGPALALPAFTIDYRLFCGTFT